MKLITSTFLSFTATSAKLLNAFFLVKLVSIYIGPEGLAKMGQFHSFIYLMVLLSGGGINQGIVKYISEYYNDEFKIKSIVECGFTIVLISSLFFFVAIFLFKEKISFAIFGTGEFSTIFAITAFFQIFISFGSYFLSILNGFKKFFEVFSVSFFGTIISAISSCLLLYFFGFAGILFAYVFSQASSFLFSIFFLKNIFFKNIYSFKISYNFGTCKSLLSYSLMTIISAVISNGSQFLIRNKLADTLSWVEVGYWEGVVRVSDAYIILLTTALSIYCVPIFSGKSEKKDIINEVKLTFLFIVPLTFMISMFIYTFRFYVVDILFSNEFYKMTDLFFWQLIGDIFRVSGMIFSYFLVAKARVKNFIFIEIFCSLLYLMLSYTFIPAYGLQGVIYAFLLNSLIFFIIGIFNFYKIIIRWDENK